MDADIQINTTQVMSNSLERFVAAQEQSYEQAFREISSGRKSSHWMWYIFPQIEGLGTSDMNRKYSIHDLREAELFLHHPILGNRLIRISEQLLTLEGKSAYAIFGTPDDMKLRSSMTLFSLVKNAPPVFQQVINKYFDGQWDPKTLKLAGKPASQ
jgi:uncharacterized protein (DUF1810 family)